MKTRQIKRFLSPRPPPTFLSSAACCRMSYIQLDTFSHIRGLLPTIAVNMCNDYFLFLNPWRNDGETLSRALGDGASESFEDGTKHSTLDQSGCFGSKAVN